MSYSNDIEGMSADNSKSHSTASFNVEDMKIKMEELSKKASSLPNVFVMTNKTFYEVRSKIKNKPDHESFGELPELPNMFHGVPVEKYETVKECLDRMMNIYNGERIQLVLSEDIPHDCLSHPWVVQRVREVLNEINKGNVDW